MITGVDHVQLAMPRGREDAARSFYAGLLGMTERVKTVGGRLAIDSGKGSGLTVTATLPAPKSLILPMPK